VATEAELNQFMKLAVVSAAAYLEKDSVGDIETWIDIVLADKGKLVNVDGDTRIRIDSRTRAWTPVHLKDFIGRLVDERGKAKASGDKALSNALKLLINTLYGDLASPYFSFGNTVIANNITARARVGTWMLNKALHTRQSITDGGIYTPLTVPCLNPNAKKPGFDTLADNKRWKGRRGSGRGFKKLGDFDWKSQYDAIAKLPKDEVGERLKEFGEHLDHLAIDHVNEFWQHYGLSLPFKIEHKGENTFIRGAYTSKAHYALRTLAGKVVFKIRGAKEFGEEKELNNHPLYEILTNLLDDKNDMPEDLQYDHTLLEKVGLWKKAQLSPTEGSYADYAGKRPGDEVRTKRTARFNNTQFPCDTVIEFKRRKDRKTKQNGNPAQWFERYRNRGWGFVQKQALKDARFEHKDI
jgi:hypothetical protein